MTGQPTEPPQQPTAMTTGEPDISQFSFEKRVDQTMRWMIAGHREADIFESISEAWPGQSVKKLMNAVAAEFEKSAELSPALIRGWIYESRMEIFRNLMEIGDFVGALRALRDIEDAAK